MPQTDYQIPDYESTDHQSTGNQPADYQAAVALFLRTRNVTRCPTVCAVPTQATVADDDRAAYRDYVAAKEAARLEKAKALRHLVHPWSSLPM